MNSILQIKSLVFSFIFGIFFYFVAKYNLFIIKKLSIFKSYFITLIFIIDLVLLYIFFMFKINMGNFHIYFLFSILGGFVTVHFSYEKIVNMCKLLYSKFKRN